ncbi:hypothetical protein DFH28DRAFT_956652 [Melampsora americana]|nr:hypothetical protein DFH28DRAFT_956652 [Melampsora americana]
MSDNCEVVPLRAHQILKHHLDLRNHPTQSFSDTDRTRIDLPLNCSDTPNTSFLHESQFDLLVNPGPSSLLCEDGHHQNPLGSTATSIPTVDESDFSRPRNLPSLSTLDVISSFRCGSQDPDSDWVSDNVEIPDLSRSGSCNLCEELAFVHDEDEAESESDNEAQDVDYLNDTLVEDTTRSSDESQRSTEPHFPAEIPNRIEHYVAVDKSAPGPLTMILFGDRVIYDSQKQPGRARTRLSVKRPLDSSACDDFAKRLKKSSKVTIH